MLQSLVVFMEVFFARLAPRGHFNQRPLTLYRTEPRRFSSLALQRSQ